MEIQARERNSRWGVVGVSLRLPRPLLLLYGSRQIERTLDLHQRAAGGDAGTIVGLQYLLLSGALK